MKKWMSMLSKFKACFQGKKHLHVSVFFVSRLAFSRGMTLVELLAVTVILSLVTSAVLLLHAQSWHASYKDNKQLTAAHIAQFVLEEWLAQDYQRIKEKMDESPLTLGKDDVLDDIWDNNTEYQSYTPKIELAYADTTRQAGPIRVTITIESKGTSQNKRSVTLHGIKAETTPPES